MRESEETGDSFCAHCLYWVLRGNCPPNSSVPPKLKPDVRDFKDSEPGQKLTRLDSDLPRAGLDFEMGNPWLSPGQSGAGRGWRDNQGRRTLANVQLAISLGGAWGRREGAREKWDLVPNWLGDLPGTVSQSVKGR